MSNSIKHKAIEHGLANESSFLFSKLRDYAELTKLKLLSLVVFSSMLSYVISSHGDLSLTTLFLLLLGGVLVTGGANTINQVIEKDTDALMTRTKDRPLPAKRMAVSEAIIFGGLISILGTICLYAISPLAAVLGALSLFTYAFLYTPLKRSTSFSVFIGAIPGALPVVIGGVAFPDYSWELVALLFAIQFFWQFPHFWAIAWKGHDQYKNAGFKLLPSSSGELDASVGRISFIYSLVLLPLVFCLYGYMGVSIGSTVLLFIFSIAYSYYCWRLWKDCSNKAALNLMFSSFLYLPFSLIILVIEYTYFI